MSREKQNITVALPPSDQNPRDYYVSLYLVFKTSDQITATKSLNKGLSHLTTLLPWIAGRVFRPDGAVPRERHISWPKPAVPESLVPQLRAATTPPGMPTLEELTRTHAPLPMGLDNMGDVPSYADPNSQSPVLGGSYIQIEGGLVVSVWAHHNVVDGHGLDVLVRLWAECTRASGAGGGGVELADKCTIPAADEPASRESTLLAAFRDKLGEDEVRRIAELPDPFGELAARHREYTFGPVDAATRAELQKLLTRRGTWATKIFRFPIGRLERLRTLLQETPGDDDGVQDGSTISINNTLNALLWSIITRVKVEAGMQGGETSEFTTAVDGRSRLGLGRADSGDGPAYMGNMSLQTQAALPVSALLEASRCTPKGVLDGDSSSRGLRRAADVIGESVASLDARYFYEFYTLMGRADQVTRLYKGFFPGGEMDLMCSSWANFGTYACDFGADLGNKGRPVFVRTPYINRLRNVMLVLPRRRGDGADEVVEVVISLDRDILESLDNESVFQSWCV